MAAAVGAGGDAVRVHSLALVVDDPAEALASARDAAWRDARGRAEQYAALAGAALGRVLRIEERAAEPQGPLRAYALAGSAGPAVEAGETPQQVATTVTWTLGDAPGAAGRR